MDNISPRWKDHFTGGGLLRTCILFICVIIPLNAQPIAQWVVNGVPVCDTTANVNIYLLPQIASDGNGGAVVCWRDARNGADYDIYAQHIASDGTMLWQKHGIPVVIAPGSQQYPRIMSDDQGGAYLAWEDSRSLTTTFVYAQHIDGQGNSQWQIGGVKVAEKRGLFISLARDGRGGLLLAWNGPSINNVTVQRLDALGTRVWGDGGVQISTRPGPVSTNDVAVIHDERGGAIVAWSQGEYKQEQVFVQRVDSIGLLALSRKKHDAVSLSQITGRSINVVRQYLRLVKDFHPELHVTVPERQPAMRRYKSHKAKSHGKK
ncbi:MAG: hypothetical protein AB1428_05875 [Bacteroidota bacterium]